MIFSLSRGRILPAFLFIWCISCLSMVMWIALDGPNTTGTKLFSETSDRDRWSFPYKAIIEPLVNAEWTAGREVLIGVTSNPTYRDKRDAIRATWATHPRFRVVFFMGAGSSESTNEIADEAKNYGDIVQYNYVDHYNNLTLKTVSLILWADQHPWMGRTHVIKADDDVFVNTRVLIRHLPQFHLPGLYGQLRVGHEPIRDVLSKWYLSVEEFPAKVFPPHLPGCIYIIHEESIDPLRKYLFRPRFNFIEDIYLTGVVAEEAKVSRYNVPSTAEILDVPEPVEDLALIWFVGDVNLDLTNVLAVHYVEPELQKNYWKHINKAS